MAKAKAKPKDEHGKEQGKPKEKERGARGSGHFVTIHEGGESHAVYIKGPAPKGMKRGGMPESVRKHLDKKVGEHVKGQVHKAQATFREKVAAHKAKAAPNPIAKAEGRGTPERAAIASAPAKPTLREQVEKHRAENVVEPRNRSEIARDIRKAKSEVPRMLAKIREMSPTDRSKTIANLQSAVELSKKRATRKFAPVEMMSGSHIKAKAISMFGGRTLRAAIAEHKANLR